jgi:hypothetical protein
MVIDKWTLCSSNNNSLSIPLLGHKSKETFIELKNSYEKLRSLNHKCKKWRKSPKQKGQIISNESEFKEIKEYLEKINLILISIDELISENYNYFGGEKGFNANEKNNIYKSIYLECNKSKDIMNSLKKENINYNFDINSYFSRCKNTINDINNKLKKEKYIESIITLEQEQERSNQSLININPNIDRGQINIFSSRREYNNSRIIENNLVHFTIEEAPLSNFIRLILFCFGTCFILFICYLCMP